MAYPEQDLSIMVGKRIIYTYDNGWLYELYFHSDTLLHYRVHSGLVGGRWVTNREITMKGLGAGMVRANWVEPVGNVVALVINPGDRWLHGFFLMPQWIVDNPKLTVCHEDEHVDEMLTLREKGPTWPMHFAEDSFATINVLEDVGAGRDDIITCSPDDLPAEWYSERGLKK